MADFNPNNPNNYIAYGPNTNCTLAVCPVDASVLGYRPSVPASAVFIALFCVTLVLHLVQGLWYRSTLSGFAIPIVLGCIDEIIGYIGRLILHTNPFSFSGFLMQIICITTSPVFFCAAIYITLSKTIVYLDVSVARFNPKFLYWFFIPCDVVSLILQAAGGAMSSTDSGPDDDGSDGSSSNGTSTSTRSSNNNNNNNSSSSSNNDDSGAGGDFGVDISLAGLGLQVFTLVVFIALAADYLLRYRRRHTRPWTTAEHRAHQRQRQRHTPRFLVFLTFLGLAVLFILIRCVYRIDELSEGYSGNLFRNEHIFYGLESAMIAAAVFCLNVSQPGFGLKTKTTRMSEVVGLTDK